MSTRRQVLDYQRLRNSAAWRLLSAQNAPVILGVLETHLHSGQARLPASLFLERVERGLQALREIGQELPQTAKAYVGDWLAAGYLERFLPADSSEEEYRLSSASSQAIQIIRGLASPRSSTTESRLSLVAQQLRQLADETDPDTARRRQQLLAQRERLDAQLDALEAGELEPMAADRARERIDEVLDLASELTNDFGRVSQAFEALHRELREQLLDDDKTRGEVLEALFEGVDVIADSDAGRSFDAFWQLLTDPVANADLEDALEQLLDREFVTTLAPASRRFLMHLPQVLLKRGGEVHEVQQRFARSLKHFVQSGEFREQRRLLARLREAQRQALANPAIQERVHGNPNIWISEAWLDKKLRREPIIAWEIVEQRIKQGFAGIRVPSQVKGATDRDINIVFWQWTRRSPTKVRVIDDENRLPTPPI